MQYTELGKLNSIDVKYYENNGPHNIAVVQLGIGVEEIGTPINLSQALIEVYMDYFGNDLDNPTIREIIVYDRDDIISDATALVSLAKCSDPYSENPNLKISDSYSFDQRQQFYSSLIDETCLQVNFEYSYDQVPESWVLVSNAWDYKRNIINNYFNDGLTVIDPNPALLPDEEPEKVVKVCKPTNVQTRNDCSFGSLINFERQKAQLVLESFD